MIVARADWPAVPAKPGPRAPRASSKTKFQPHLEFSRFCVSFSRFSCWNFVLFLWEYSWYLSRWLMRAASPHIFAAGCASRAICRIGRRAGMRDYSGPPESLSRPTDRAGTWLPCVAVFMSSFLLIFFLCLICRVQRTDRHDII